MLVPPEGKSASTIIRLRRLGSEVIGESSDPQLGNIQIRLVESAPQLGSVRPFAGEIVGWALDVGNPFDPAKDVRVTFSKAVVEGEGFSDPSSLAINGRIDGAITFENGRGAVGNCQTVSFSLNRYFPAF